MEKKSLVSIIIPMYNSQPYIEETLISALNQSYKNIEIIVIDDGSTDNSLMIAKKFESSRLKIFHQVNKGASAARNLGIKMASGEFIQFLDADDVISEDKIEKQLLVIGNNQTLSFCQTIYFNENLHYKSQLPNPQEERFLNFNQKPSIFMTNLWGGFSGKGSMIALHSWLTPKALIEKAGFWNENLSLDDDGEYFARVALIAKQLVYVKDTYAYYRKSKKTPSLSKSSDAKAYNSALQSIISKKKLLMELYPTFEAECAIYHLLMDLSFKVYLRHPEIYKEIKKELPKITYPYPLNYGGHKVTRVLSNKLGWKLIVLLQVLKERLK